MTAKKPDPTPVDPLLYSMEQTCARLNIGKTTLYAEIAAGELETVNIGDRRLTTAQMQLDYIERKRRKAAA